MSLHHKNETTHKPCHGCGQEGLRNTGKLCRTCQIRMDRAKADELRWSLDYSLLDREISRVETIDLTGPDQHEGALTPAGKEYLQRLYARRAELEQISPFRDDPDR